ncbi:MAG: hypothetical protein WD530_03700, partial [Vicingaceae bacterium]
SFGDLIHEITGSIIPSEIPGLHEVNAVDEAGVHPLLFAIGSERYTPYAESKQPAELLTIANHILGFGQMSLAKYLFISDKADNPALKLTQKEAFFKHMLERADWKRDLHFQTKTTIDTLDYSSEELNFGSKVVIAALGQPIRKLATEVPSDINWPQSVKEVKMASAGLLAVQFNAFTNYENAQEELAEFTEQLKGQMNRLNEIALMVIVDDAPFVAANFSNFLWVTFTRSNPSHDVYGVDSFTQFKHWGCKGPLIIDARIKSHHAPPLETDPAVEKSVDALGAKGAPLYGII